MLYLAIALVLSTAIAAWATTYTVDCLTTEWRHYTDARSGRLPPIEEDEPPHEEPLPADEHFQLWHADTDFDTQEESDEMYGLWAIVTHRRDSSTARRNEAYARLARYGCPMPSGFDD